MGIYTTINFYYSITFYFLFSSKNINIFFKFYILKLFSWNRSERYQWKFEGDTVLNNNYNIQIKLENHLQSFKNRCFELSSLLPQRLKWLCNHMLSLVTLLSLELGGKILRKVVFLKVENDFRIKAYQEYGVVLM